MAHFNGVGQLKLPTGPGREPTQGLEDAAGQHIAAHHRLGGRGILGVALLDDACDPLHVTTVPLAPHAPSLLCLLVLLNLK